MSKLQKAKDWLDNIIRLTDEAKAIADVKMKHVKAMEYDKAAEAREKEVELIKQLPTMEEIKEFRNQLN